MLHLIAQCYMICRVSLSHVLSFDHWYWAPGQWSARPTRRLVQDLRFFLSRSMKKFGDNWRPYNNEKEPRMKRDKHANSLKRFHLLAAEQLHHSAEKSSWPTLRSLSDSLPTSKMEYVTSTSWPEGERREFTMVTGYELTPQQTDRSTTTVLSVGYKIRAHTTNQVWSAKLTLYQNMELRSTSTSKQMAAMHSAPRLQGPLRTEVVQETPKLWWTRSLGRYGSAVLSTQSVQLLVLSNSEPSLVREIQ